MTLDNTESPKYLACPWCPAQSYKALVQTRPGLLRYICPAQHTFFIIEEDPSFNYGNEGK